MTNTPQSGDKVEITYSIQGATVFQIVQAKVATVGPNTVTLSAREFSRDITIATVHLKARGRNAWTLAQVVSTAP